MANLSYIKLSGITYTLVDDTAVHSLEGYYTSAQTDAAITAATDALATTIAEQGYQNATQVSNAITAVTNPINNTLTAHTANTEIHVTVANKNAWNAKLDASDVEGFFGAVNYDSNTKRINFYNETTGGTVLAYIDATDFVKDGFLQSVVLENRTISGESVPCMVFTWNTDAGVSETVIPVGGVFDPTNYYTKAEADAAITAATTPINNALTAHTANTTVHVTANDKSTWTAKQDALVSGTNIKTVNGNSLLGSGDITVQNLPTVSGTTLIFS